MINSNLFLYLKYMMLINTIWSPYIPQMTSLKPSYWCNWTKTSVKFMYDRQTIRIWKSDQFSQLQTITFRNVLRVHFVHSSSLIRLFDSFSFS